MDHTTAQKLHSLLQTVLAEGFRTEAHLFTPPYQDLNRIDQGIRNMVWPDFSDKDVRPIAASQSEERRLVVTRSNLGFYNIILYLTLEGSPDFISIGPFRAEEFSEDYFPNILKEVSIPASATFFLKYFYENLPYLSLSPIVNVVRNIAAAFYPVFETTNPVYLDFSGQAHKLHINMELLQDTTRDYADQLRETLFGFLHVLKKGDTDAAQKALQIFLRKSHFASSRNIAQCKTELDALNLYCQMAIMDTPVHTSHVLKLCTQLTLKISQLKNQEEIAAMPGEISHKYCLLVKNYAYPEYSQTIRAVINYIQSHLDEELTSSYLAQHFHRNPASLSAAFSREVGTSITGYIKQLRIEEAIRYFNTTKMSVSEVAVTVGFTDFAYFSRIFKKLVGCSPREYCRDIKSR